MIVAGIDEAGYGSLLGPLVVSMSLFRVDRAVPAPEASPAGIAGDLWKALAPVVRRRPASRAMAVNDSKKLFQQGKGLRNLEEGLLPFLLLRHEEVPRDFRRLLSLVVPGREGPNTAGYLDRYPWYRNRNLPLPRDTFVGAVRKLAGRLQERSDRNGVRFLGLAAYPVEVAEFNRGLDTFSNKAEVSFRVIGFLLKKLWDEFPEHPVDVLVDRQGGRTRYAAHLFEKLHPRGIHIDEQTEERSVYRLTRRRGRSGVAPQFRVSFAKDSEEQCLPVALGSMLAKYLRELHMAIFNQYWSEHGERLKPTAGYVQDGRRFLEDTSAIRRRLGIDDALLIRKR